MSAQPSTCAHGPWSLDNGSLLHAHYVRPHSSEWSEGCCSRRRAWPKGDGDPNLVVNAVRLIMIVAADSSNVTRALAVHNIATLWHLRTIASASWVFVTYDGGGAEDWSDVSATANLLGVHVRIVSYSARGAAPAFTPKLALQLRGFDALPSIEVRRADAIWLPDADIWLSDPNSAHGGARAFLLRWACAFRHGPPLVAQPVVRGLQQFWHLNYDNEWQPGGRLAAAWPHEHRRAIALHTAFVEQQMPLMDASFWQWFVDTLGRPLAALQLEHGSDLGADSLWCKAAGAFAAMHDTHAGRVACAVVPVPFEHRGTADTRPSLHQRRGGASSRPTAPLSYWRGGGAVREQASRRWPQFWMSPRLMQMYKLTSEHVEVHLRGAADACMVRETSSTGLGPPCKRPFVRPTVRDGAGMAASSQRRRRKRSAGGRRLLQTPSPSVATTRVVVDGRDLHQPTGGPEALLQFALALQSVVGDSRLRLLCNLNAHPIAARFQHEYGGVVDALAEQCIREPRRGDLLVVPQTRACMPRYLAKGVRVMRYWLASGSYEEWAARRANGWRHQPCSGELAHSDEAASSIRRFARCVPHVVHPYLTPSITLSAPSIVDGASVKRNLLLLNHDLGRVRPIPTKPTLTMLQLANESARALGGSVALVEGLDQSELVPLYRAAKAVMGWCMQGSERIPLEAALYGVVLMTNRCGHTAAPIAATTASATTQAGTAAVTIGGTGSFPPSALLPPYEATSNDAGETLSAWLRESLASVFGSRYEDHVRASASLREQARRYTPQSMIEEARAFVAAADIDGGGRDANASACARVLTSSSGKARGHGARGRQRRANRARNRKNASRRTLPPRPRPPAEPYSLWDRANITRPAVIGNATARAAVYAQLTPLLAQSAPHHSAVVVGAHLFAADALDPVAALLAPHAWGGALLIEASPLTAQRLRRQMNLSTHSPLPKASMPPTVANVGICPDDFDGGLNRTSRFHTLTASGDGLPPWTSQVSSFSRRGVTSLFSFLSRQSVKHGTGSWTVKRLDASVQTSEVECVGLTTALRRHPSIPPPLVLTIDTEGLDCRIVASEDWCAPWLRPRLLVFEFSHCTTNAFRRAQARLRACEGFAGGPAFADKENIYYLWGHGHGVHAPWRF